MTTNTGATPTTEQANSLPAQINQDTAVQPMIGGMEIAPNAVMFDPGVDMPDIAGLATKKKSAITTNPDYHEFEQGEVIRGVYLGIAPHRCKDQMTGVVKTIPAAVFVNDKRQTKKNGAAKFRAHLEDKPMYYEFEVVMTGIKKGKSGNMIQQFAFNDLSD